MAGPERKEDKAERQEEGPRDSPTGNTRAHRSEVDGAAEPAPAEANPTGDQTALDRRRRQP